MHKWLIANLSYQTELFDFYSFHQDMSINKISLIMLLKLSVNNHQNSHNSIQFNSTLILQIRFIWFKTKCLYMLSLLPLAISISKLFEYYVQLRNDCICSRLHCSRQSHVTLQWQNGNERQKWGKSDTNGKHTKLKQTTRKVCVFFAHLHHATIIYVESAPGYWKKKRECIIIILPIFNAWRDKVSRTDDEPKATTKLMNEKKKQIVHKLFANIWRWHFVFMFCFVFVIIRSLLFGLHWELWCLAEYFFWL